MAEPIHILRGRLQPEYLTLKGKLVAAGPGSADIYTGTYEVIPSIEVQTLATSQKLLLQDISVLEIPTYETSNLYGTTFIIGG